MALLPGRPVASRKLHIAAHGSRPNVIMALIQLALFSLLFIVLTREIYGYYHSKAQSLLVNGVGQNSQEGISPLGFHSALGSTNQPSAIVRLEGDYPENPTSPSLYLRESALSGFNGNEMVIAPRTYDSDVPAIIPEEAFKGESDESLGHRKQLIQSVFLLTEHKLAFAVDYPISVTRLKNPNPGRFKGAYRAISLAPIFTQEELLNSTVGDPHWSDTPSTWICDWCSVPLRQPRPQRLWTDPPVRYPCYACSLESAQIPDSPIWRHYTTPHQDPRYGALAQQITAGLASPVAQAAALSQYLSEKSIYTLAPNHTVTQGQDQVAPYLFGDKRGYCVHFAHAMVYMLRSLGIPARIGTGYMTDLSQARDGHILLRMSDRHAWAEVFVTGKGWVVFDVQPTQVESHADSQVDMKLLEELMGMLEPGEEILPKDSIKDEEHVYEPPAFELPSRDHILVATGCVLIMLALLQLWMLFSWVIPVGARWRLRRSAISVMLLLCACGIRRKMGETREEFRLRVATQYNLKTLTLVDQLSRSFFAKADAHGLRYEEVAAARRADITSLVLKLGWRSRLAYLNPAPALRRICGARW